MPVVKFGPYNSAPTSGTANFGGTTQNQIRSFITIGRKYRLRKNGTVTRARFYYAGAAVTAVGMWVTVWREDLATATFSLVGRAAIPVADLSPAAVNDVLLETAISGCLEGDYIGYEIQTGSNTSAQLTKADAQTGATTYYSTAASAPASTGVAWRQQTSAAGTIAVFELYGTPAPDAIVDGDSNAAGHPAHYTTAEADSVTYVEGTEWAPGSALHGYLAEALGLDIVNLGIGSTMVSGAGGIATRIAADVVAMTPTFAVLNGGVNDLIHSPQPDGATVLAAWVSMLTACDAAGVPVVALPMYPWRSDYPNDSAPNRATRLAWNAALKAELEANWPACVYVDTDPTLLDPANDTYLLAAYASASHPHMLPAGHAAVAAQIAGIITPGTPAGLSASREGESLTLSWTAPTVPAGSPAITAYVLYADGVELARSATESYTYAAGAEAPVITVAAFNGFVIGAQTAGVVAPAHVPAAPTKALREWLLANVPVREVYEEPNAMVDELLPAAALLYSHAEPAPPGMGAVTEVYNVLLIPELTGTTPAVRGEQLRALEVALIMAAKTSARDNAAWVHLDVEYRERAGDMGASQWYLKVNTE